MNTDSLKNIKQINFKSGQNTWISHNEPFIYHCHHYNTFLQYTLELVKNYFDVYTIQKNSAQEVAFSYFNNIFSWNRLSKDERLEMIKLVYSDCGFGSLQFSNIDGSGGTITSPNEHYAYAWKLKFRERAQDEEAVGLFTCGFLAGAFDALFNQTIGTYHTAQPKCLTKGDDNSEFVVSLNSKTEVFEPTPHIGRRTIDLELKNNPDSPIDYVGIRAALTGMKMKGDDEGLIRSFGVILTHHFANYYPLISYRFLFELEKTIGEAGLSMAKDLLVEAGHVCAFHTYGGIMLSAEWNALIKPSIKSKEDWIHGIIGVVNAFGWGFYQITDLEPGKKLVIRIDNGYESNFFLDKYGKVMKNISYLAAGGCLGIMNLLYNADITESPDLTREYYEEISKSDKKFKVVQTKCRVAGDDYDEMTVTR